MVTITKSIVFMLTTDGTEISLPDLMKKGHARAHVVSLFETLQGLGYGEFRQGSKGRGQYSRFLKNDTCPDEFVLKMEEKPRGRPRKNANVPTVEVNSSPAEAPKDDISVDINAGKITAEQLIEAAATQLSAPADEVPTVEVNEDITAAATENEIAATSNDEQAVEAPAAEPNKPVEDLGEIVSEMAVVQNTTAAAKKPAKKPAAKKASKPAKSKKSNKKSKNAVNARA